MTGGGFSITLCGAAGMHKRTCWVCSTSRRSSGDCNAISNKFGAVRSHSPSSTSEQLPIRTIDFADPADVARHDRMVALVTQMLDLHARLAAEGVPHEKAALQRRIEMTDRQIDALVYELYGLSDEEIGIVEASG